MPVLTIGRAATNHIIKAERSVSNVHLTANVQGRNTIVIEDQSTFGTWVNGRRVRKYAVRNGQTIRLGREHDGYTTSSDTLIREILRTAYPNQLDFVDYFKECLLPEFEVYKKRAKWLRLGEQVTRLGSINLLPTVLVHYISKNMTVTAVVFLLGYGIHSHVQDHIAKKWSELWAEYRQKLCCPRCSIPLLKESTAAQELEGLRKTGRCPHPKCGAQFFHISAGKAPQ